MKKLILCLFTLLFWISYCEARDQLEIIDGEKLS